MEKPREALFNQVADWYLDLTPSYVTVHNIKTEAHIEEPSYVAMHIKGSSLYAGKDLHTGESFTETFFSPDKILAVGKAALEYKNKQDVIVFSPFRHGQIAHYAAAEHFIKTMLKQAVPKIALLKPVVVIRVQRQTTEVEERAIIDAGIQAGARKVLLYRESFAEILRWASEDKQLQNAILIHIDPQE